MSHAFRHYVDHLDRDVLIGTIPGGRTGKWVTKPGKRIVISNGDFDIVDKDSTPRIITNLLRSVKLG